jgi:phytoene dehydrogenase-like protein
MRDEADAIIVGSGINGLVSAAELAQSGWSVILLERNAEIGGFIATEERTLPGYLHDTFSSWHPLFVSGPAYAALGELLHRHGLEYRNTDDWVTASVSDDGRATFVHRDPERTAAEFAYAEDRSTYLAMLRRLGENMASIGGLLGSEVRSLALVRHMTGLVRNGGLRGAEWWLRAAITSGRAYLRRDFRGHEVDHLYAPWLRACRAFTGPRLRRVLDTFVRRNPPRLRSPGGCRGCRPVCDSVPLGAGFPRRARGDQLRG